MKKCQTLVLVLCTFGLIFSFGNAFAQAYNFEFTTFDDAHGGTPVPVMHGATAVPAGRLVQIIKPGALATLDSAQTGAATCGMVSMDNTFSSSFPMGTGTGNVAGLFDVSLTGIGVAVLPAQIPTGSTYWARVWYDVDANFTSYGIATFGGKQYCDLGPYTCPDRTENPYGNGPEVLCVDSPTWHTMPVTASITLTNPIGGGYYIVGSNYNIQWGYRAGISGNVNIDLNRNYPNGTWENLTTVNVTSSPYPWTVSGAMGSNARIQIYTTANHANRDASSSNFVISDLDWTQTQTITGGPGNTNSWNPTIPGDVNTGGNAPAAFSFAALVVGTNPNSLSLRLNSRANAASGWGLNVTLLDPSTTLNRFWDITSDGSNMNASIKLRFTSAQLPAGITDPINQIIYAYVNHGAGWTTMAVDSVRPYGGGVFSASIHGVTGFSYWSLGSNPPVLPVELTSFTANAGDSKVSLHWRTESETNNRLFQLYRSLNNTDHGSIITEIPGHGTTSQPNNYSYNDFTVVNGKTYYYMLADLSLDGQVEFTNLRVSATPQTTAQIAVPTSCELVQIYPNPFNIATDIEYAIDQERVIDLSIYSITGRKIAVLASGRRNAGVYHTVFDGRKFASGIYFIQLKAEDISLMRKITLLK